MNSTTSSVESRRNETIDLLKYLVDQFATVVRSVQSGLTSSTTSGGRADSPLSALLIYTVSDLNGWNDQVSQQRSCLGKGAKDCGYADTLAGVYGQLLAMYSLTPEAREQPHHLIEDDGESYLRLGNKVERLTGLAYAGMEPHMGN